MTQRRQLIAILVLGVAFLLLFRESGPTNYQVGVLTRCMILMIVAIGLNVLIGHAGLVSLGQAALYGLGAYVAAWLAVKQGVQFLPAVAAGVAVTALFGAILAYPTVRVRGVYLAVITIAFGLVFQNILVEWLSVTGGTQGLIGIPRGQAFGVPLTRPIYFWVVAGSLILAFLVQYNIINSRYGRAMRATAQSENAARALGINIAATRTLAFVISAALAGLAGGLYTFLNLFVNFETFTFFHSISFLLMVILGGTGTLAGPIVGASILTYIAEILQDLREWQIFAYGVLLAALMFVMPRGIMGSLGPLYDRLILRPRSRVSGKWPDPAASVAALLGTGKLSSADKTSGADKTSSEAVLAVEGLTLRFGGLTAVDDVGLRIDAGAVHALIGPNGAGKSSVLNLVSGFYTPTTGRIAFLGRDIAGRPSHELARLGIARTFQNTELFGQMTVLENVLAAADMHHRNTLAETLLRLPRFGREERAFLGEARELLQYGGLSDYADEEARNLPFGHQRRLEIARALALRPRLLLLDEPAAGLTHSEIEDLKALIRLLAASGVTVILVEHHVEMVMTVSDQVTVLDYGRVIASGTAAQVRNDPQVIEAYFGSGKLVLERAAPVAARGAAE
jgi:branched-chain amino acid transport system permease protein